MHFDSVEDYWNFTRWLDRRITVSVLRDELADIVENDYTVVMHHIKHTSSIGQLSMFTLAPELTTDEMCKFIQLSYDKWYSMRTPVNKPISWRSGVIVSGDMYYE